MKALRLYQKNGMRYIIQRKCVGLFWEMRLGKTITTIKAIRTLKGYPCLIVAPYSAFLSWIDELKDCGEDVIQLTGTRDERLQKLTTNENWYLINKEGFLVIPELKDYQWGAIVIDESTCLKNPKTKTSKYFVNNFKDAPIKILLAGIPAPESILNYLQQLKFLGRLDMSYWQFVHKYCLVAGYENYVLRSGRNMITKALADCAAYLKLEDVGLGALKVYERRLILLRPEAMKQYNEIVNNLKISESMMTIFKSVGWCWARQLLGGFIEGKMIYDEKIKEIKYLLDNELNDSRGKIILAFFKNEIYYLKYALEKKYRLEIITHEVPIEKRMQIAKDFQAKNLKLIICQPEVVKYGLNFSSASSVIFYSTPTGLETRYQCEARAMLQQSLLIVDLICKDTIEEDINQSLMKKEKEVKMAERIIRRLQCLQ